MLYTLGNCSASLEIIFSVCAIEKQYIVLFQIYYIILDSFYKVTFKKNATIEMKYACSDYFGMQFRLFNMVPCISLANLCFSK